MIFGDIANVLKQFLEFKMHKNIKKTIRRQILKIINTVQYVMQIVEFIIFIIAMVIKIEIIEKQLQFLSLFY